MIIDKKTLDKSELCNNDFVEVKRMGNIVEVRNMLNRNFEMPIVVVEGGRYYYRDNYEIDDITGEIKTFEFNHADNRSENKESLRRTFKKLRDLINTNFVGGFNEKFVTLTYRQQGYYLTEDGNIEFQYKTPMRDSKKLYTDVDKFMKRLRYHYKDISKIEYINVVEPQNDGSWHCHILMKFIDVENIFLPYTVINDHWKQGWSDVRKVDNCDNIGAYLTAYLCDVVLDDPKDIIEIGGDVVEKEITFKGEKVKKKVIKGERLKFYPNDFKLFRPSRGLKRPVIEKMKNKDIKKELGCDPNYIQKINIKDENNKILNTITYEYYNIKNKKNNRFDDAK